MPLKRIFKAVLQNPCELAGLWLCHLLRHNKKMDRTGFSHAVVVASGAEAPPAFLNPWPLACEASDLPLIYRPIADGNSGRPILMLPLLRRK